MVLKRHSVTIKRPATTLDSRGQVDTSATPTTVAEDVPASIEHLQGREVEIARQIVPTATHRVKFFGDPAWSLTPGDYLVPDSDSTRKLNIGDIAKPEDIDAMEYILLCGEELAV